MTTLDAEQQDALWHGAGRKLRGRVAFVTGGTRGIGAAICRSLGTQLATVAAGYARNSAHAKEFADDFAQQNGACPATSTAGVCSGSKPANRRTMTWPVFVS